jgi:hypothetical protein
MSRRLDVLLNRARGASVVIRIDDLEARRGLSASLDVR